MHSSQIAAHQLEMRALRLQVQALQNLVAQQRRAMAEQKRHMQHVLGTVRKFEASIGFLFDGTDDTAKAISGKSNVMNAAKVECGKNNNNDRETSTSSTVRESSQPRVLLNESTGKLNESNEAINDRNRKVSAAGARAKVSF